MDMMLPGMDGLRATEYLMAHCPTPILIVSSSTNRGELFKTYDALAAGAVDVLDKPHGRQPAGYWERSLVSAVRMAARIRVITHPGLRAGGTRAIAAPVPHATSGHHPCSVVVLGTSTGGPGALVDVLSGLPDSFHLPVLFVLHIAEPFGTAFAAWLENQIGRRVDYARDGQPVAAAANTVVMAPPGRHLVVRNTRLVLSNGPERHSCRPSVDELFESVAREYGPGAAACLLTGMGRDGADGLASVDRSGGLTIAQDEATSVVYGMPREAVLRGAAQYVLPLGEIGPALAALTTGKDAMRP